ncbi:MAG: hypothetical protein CMH52_08390 [Myxococcales bacterium]|nr:hypothetical protein [Myxococcales bacterium]
MGDTQIKIGPFALDHAIAEGGMGQVWQGIHTGSNLPIAIKVLTGRMAQRPRFRQTFRNEARAMSRLDHPNIVRIYEYGLLEAGSDAERYFGPSAPYIAMEYVAGHVAHHSQLGDWNTLKRWLIALLDGLAHAHARGVVHRDLKPNNLLLGLDGRVKLSDFGIAFATDDSGIDMERLRAAGTPEFMAPEQCHGQWRDFGPWTDLYAVGCVAFALACGHPPFQEEHPMGTMLAKLERDPPIMRTRFRTPPGFERWVRRLLKKTPRNRFQRAADAAWALKGLAVIDTEESMVSLGEDINDIGQDTLLRSGEDTIVTGGFDTDASLEGDAIKDLEPTYEGVSTSHLRATRAPIPIDWRAGRRRQQPPMKNVGLELFGLRNPPLIGREALCDTLWESLRQVHTIATPQAVVLRGPSGVGKTRIASWLCERAHELGAATVLKAHHAMTSGSTDGLVPMLARHLRCTGLDRRATKERLNALMVSQGAPTDEADALTELMKPTPHSETSSENTIRFFSVVERRLVLGKQLERIALDRTVILWIDDAQWGYESLDFVQWILERRRSPFLVILTVRDEALSERVVESMALDDLDQLDNVDEFSVEPLDEAGHSRFIASLLSFEPSLANAVEKRTAGNPMFAIHLVRNWVNQGYLISTDGGFELAPGAPTELPQDLSEVWGARIQVAMTGRTEHDVSAIELAAVLGQEIDRDEWLTACRLSGLTPSSDLLDDMFRDHLLQPIDEENIDIGFVFVHGMLREAVETHAAENGRLEEHHRTCVALLRSQGRTDARLPRHLRGSGDLHGSLEPLRRSVSLAVSLGDHRTTNTALVEWRDTLRRMGVPNHSPAWLETDVVSCEVAVLQGHRDVADDTAKNLVKMANQERLNGLVCQCLIIRARIAIDSGNYETALAMLAEALEAYQGLEQADLYARSQQQLGRARAATGDLQGAKDAFARAEKAFLSLNDVVQSAYCLIGLANVARQQEDFTRASELASAARSDFEAAGARAGVAATDHLRGDIARFKGNVTDAEEHYRSALELYELVGSRQSIRVELDLSFLLIGNRRFLEAKLLLDRIISTCQDAGHQVLETKAKTNLLAYLTHSEDWFQWDSTIDFIKQTLVRTGILDVDIAIQLESSGQGAISQGQSERGIVALELAVGIWQGLKRSEKVYRLQKRLKDVRGMFSTWS